MGVYLNPGSNKLSWLKEQGVEISKKEAMEHNDHADIMLVVYMFNGVFDAAAIAYNKAEQQEFLSYQDSRIYRYFLVEFKAMPEGTQTEIRRYQR